MPVDDVIEAARNATEYFAKLMTVSDIRLEEVEMSADERFWYVTLSGLVPAQKAGLPSPVEFASSKLAELFTNPQERVYKVFTVDAKTGSIQSMKIRKAE